MNKENKEEEIINNLRKETQDLKLNANEKSEMLHRIFNSPTPSPYMPVQSGWSFTSFTSKTFVYAVASFLVLLLSSSTLAYASMDSIPGESLYALKINVAEPVLDTLAFTPLARAERKAKKAIRRLGEAEQLAKRNALTRERRAELEARFKENTEDFEKEMEEIKENKKERKENLKIEFEESLDAHADILKNAREEKRQENIEEEREEEELEEEENSENDEEISEETELELLEKAVREKSRERKEERENSETDL